MQLTPCEQCRRHVDAEAGTCPFCSAPIHARARSLGPVGRLSRAAVFSFAACSGSAQQTQQVQQPPPPPPSDAAVSSDTQFATPPPGDAQATNASAGSIRGSVVSGRWPGAYLGVTLRGNGVEERTQTGTDGTFAFHNVAPGRYEVAVQPNHPHHDEQVRDVTVAAGQTVQVRYTLAVDHDPGGTAKPYGAPPARRRIV